MEPGEPVQSRARIIAESGIALAQSAHGQTLATNREQQRVENPFPFPRRYFDVQHIRSPPDSLINRAD
jgi:hypothetical protein